MKEEPRKGYKLPEYEDEADVGVLNDNTAAIGRDVAALEEDTARLDTLVEGHVANRANPHGVTAAQVGAYTKAEVDEHLIAYDSHLADRGNPHDVTAHQTGAYTMEETGRLLAEKVDRDKEFEAGKVLLATEQQAARTGYVTEDELNSLVGVKGNLQEQLNNIAYYSYLPSLPMVTLSFGGDDFPTQGSIDDEVIPLIEAAYPASAYRDAVIQNVQVESGAQRKAILWAYFDGTQSDGFVGWRYVTDIDTLIHRASGEVYGVVRDSDDITWLAGEGTVEHAAISDEADKWTVPRTLELSGAVNGSVALDGSGDVELEAGRKVAIAYYANEYDKEKTWFKVASATVGNATNFHITLLVERTIGGQEIGILQAHLRRESTGLWGTKTLKWLVKSDLPDSDFVLATNQNAEGVDTSEAVLWVRLTKRWSGYRLTVLGEGDISDGDTQLWQMFSSRGAGEYEPTTGYEWITAQTGQIANSTSGNAATADVWKAPRRITFGKDVTGEMTLDGGGDVALELSRKSAYGGFTGNSEQWAKIARLKNNITNKENSYILTLLAERSNVVNAPAQAGVLQMHARGEDGGKCSRVKLEWLTASSVIKPERFAMTYDPDDISTVELWAYMAGLSEKWRFAVVSEGQSMTFTDSFELYGKDNIKVDSLPEGRTVVYSTLSTLANDVSGKAAEAAKVTEKLTVEVDGTGYSYDGSQAVTVPVDVAGTVDRALEAFDTVRIPFASTQAADLRYREIVWLKSYTGSSSATTRAVFRVESLYGSSGSKEYGIYSLSLRVREGRLTLDDEQGTRLCLIDCSPGFLLAANRIDVICVADKTDDVTESAAVVHVYICPNYNWASYVVVPIWGGQEALTGREAYGVLWECVSFSESTLVNLADIDQRHTVPYVENALHAGNVLTTGNERPFVPTQPFHPATKQYVDEMPAGGKRYATLVVGHADSGHTLDDCDYLCDGEDDQKEINEALAALPEDGGKVLVLEGEYTLSAPVVLDMYEATLQGLGNSTRLFKDFEDSDLGGVCIEEEYCGVRDICLLGGDESGYGIRLNGCSHCTVSGVLCSGSRYGIYIGGGEGNMITGNKCMDNRYGIGLSDTYNNTLQGNTFRQNESAGIYAIDVHNIIMAGNDCSENMSYGIYIKQAIGNTITGNSCGECGYGIYVAEDSMGNTISGNNMLYCEYRCIYLTGGGDNNTLTGNTCAGGARAIDIRNESSSTVSGNTCTESEYGIYVNGGFGNTINGNGCVGAMYGVYMTATEDGAISSNTCLYCGHGISLAGTSRSTVTGNTCNESEYGIYLNRACTMNTLTGNTCVDGEYGIHLDGASFCTAVGNGLHGNEVPLEDEGEGNTTGLNGGAEDKPVEWTVRTYT